MDILVYCHRDIGPLTHFWRSTGFSPASLLLNADMRQAMAYAGSIPHGGLTYIRIHYLLDLVTAGYPGISPIFWMRARSGPGEAWYATWRCTVSNAMA
jgi:hypothetical protein